MNDPFFVVLVITGGAFFLIGLLQRVFPPKKINRFYGYRTSSSMKDQERWNFAQQYAAKEMMKIGVFFAAVSLLGIVIKVPAELASGVGILLVISGIIVLAIRVESAIKNKFGNPAL